MHAPWALALLVVSVGCASSEPEAKDESAKLDGVYYASTGPNTWASFKDATYVTWSSEARCVDVEAAPADCAEKGIFALDAARGEVVFTSDAGKVTARKMVVHESVAADGLVATRSLPIASLVNDAPSLVDKGSGSSTVASNVSLVEPGQTLLAANTFQKIGIVCRVVGMLVNPISQPVIVPATPPAPIVQQQCKVQG